MMMKSNRKRHYEDDQQATSSEKMMRRDDDEESDDEFGDLDNEVNESIKGFLVNEQLSKKYEYDPTKENQYINLVEHVNWIYNNHDEMIEHLDYPQSTFEELNLDEQYNFVDKEIYDTILQCKNALNQFNKNTLLIAKSLSNPFEINKCIFQNRSALKMANIDYLCDKMFTSPKPPLIDETKEILYFCDLCAGPGGFTEYMFFKKKWQAIGYGFTLKAENDFNLDKLPSSSVFNRFYGELGDGDLLRPKKFSFIS